MLNFSNMRLLLFATTVDTGIDSDTVITTTITAMASSSDHAHNSNSGSRSLLCQNCHSVILDILIVFSASFFAAYVLFSCFSDIFLFLAPSTPLPYQLPIPYVLGFYVFLVTSVIVTGFSCCARSQKCNKPGCKGLQNGMEFELVLQSRDLINSEAGAEIDKLPWKGGSDENPDYEDLRTELKKMAPPNGRAVYVFLARCGCPLAKIEEYDRKKGRRTGRNPPNATSNR